MGPCSPNGESWQLSANREIPWLQGAASQRERAVEEAYGARNAARSALPQINGILDIHTLW